MLQDPETGKPVPDKATMEAVYQFFADAMATGVTRKTHIGTDLNQWSNRVTNGKGAPCNWHYARSSGKDGFLGTIEFSPILAGNESGRANMITHPLVCRINDQTEDDQEDIAAQPVRIASGLRRNALHDLQPAHLDITQQQSNVALGANDRWAAEAAKRLLGTANAQPNHVRFDAFSEIIWTGREATWTGIRSLADAVAEVELKAQLDDALIFC